MDLQELESVAHRELAKYGLHDWTFCLANTKRRLGVCLYRSKRIEIAKYYATHTAPGNVLDTLMHEIAHALAGAAAGHGPKWKAVAVKLGATPRACDTSEDAATQPGDWQAICPACGKTLHLYRRPRSLNGYRCKCPAHAAITFAFVGDPAHAPLVPLTPELAAKWEARCAGCLTVHYRLRKPKTGTWRCKCPGRCELTWRPRVLS